MIVQPLLAPLVSPGITVVSDLREKQSQGEREEGERIGCGALRVNSSSGEARSGWTRLFHYSPSGAGGAGAGTTGGRIDAINANYWWTAVGGGWWEGRVQQHVGGGGREDFQLTAGTQRMQ